jgi:cyclopropane-fatty-acyl-phospholipid synthase
MREFYLAAAEMAFREQAMMVLQLQLAKRQGVVPMTRDYIARETARLHARETWPTPAATIGRQIIGRSSARFRSS